MSEGKLAAQVAHAVKNLLLSWDVTYDEAHDCDIIVLGLSDKKFDETFSTLGDFYREYAWQVDKGLTEVEAGTVTCCAWIENE